MGPVSRFPLGLLDLFGVKQNGQYPGQIADFIQPALDVGNLLFHANAETYIATTYPIAQAGAFTTAAGNYVLNPVVDPAQNELLIVSNWSVVGYCNGVASFLPYAVPAFIPPGTSSRFPFRGTHIPPLNAAGAPGITGVATTTYQSYGSDLPTVIPPGSSLVLHTLATAVGVAGGDFRLEFNLRYMRLRV